MDYSADGEFNFSSFSISHFFDSLVYFWILGELFLQAIIKSVL